VSITQQIPFSRTSGTHHSKLSLLIYLVTANADNRKYVGQLHCTEMCHEVSCVTYMTALNKTEYSTYCTVLYCAELRFLSRPHIDPYSLLWGSLWIDLNRLPCRRTFGNRLENRTSVDQYTQAKMAAPCLPPLSMALRRRLRSIPPSSMIRDLLTFRELTLYRP